MDRDNPLKAKNLKPGWRFSLWGKTWTVLGKDNGRVYFKNTKARKYASFSRINGRGQVHIGKMEKSKVLISDFEQKDGS